MPTLNLPSPSSPEYGQMLDRVARYVVEGPRNGHGAPMVPKSESEIKAKLPDARRKVVLAVMGLTAFYGE